MDNIDKNDKNIIISPTHDSENTLSFAIDNKVEFNLENYVKTSIEILDNKNGFL